MPTIAERRLWSHHLAGPPLADATSVVRGYGAVQAQEYALAQWALALRLSPTSDSVIEAALTRGDIVRTHVLRPTWHFVAPADIRWLLALSGPRVQQWNAGRYRQLGMDEAERLKAKRAVTQALEGGVCLTRDELGAALAQAGIPEPTHQRLAYFAMDAELDGLICSGPRRGKQITYALLDERVPPTPMLSRDEALIELVRRYFTSHGPATLQDFAWWSGLTGADAKTGLAALGPAMRREIIDGREHWSAADAPTEAPPPTAHLLPVYDEFTIGYRNHAAVLDPQYGELVQNGTFTSAFIVAGQIIGMWRRTVKPKSVQMELRPFRPFSEDEQAAFDAAAVRFAAFLQLPLVMEP